MVLKTAIFLSNFFGTSTMIHKKIYKKWLRKALFFFCRSPVRRVFARVNCYVGRRTRAGRRYDAVDWSARIFRLYCDPMTLYRYVLYLVAGSHWALCGWGVSPKIIKWRVYFGGCKQFLSLFVMCWHKRLAYFDYSFFSS